MKNSDVLLEFFKVKSEKYLDCFYCMNMLGGAPCAIKNECWTIKFMKPDETRMGSL